MHIEKNVCESIIGTLLNIPGKTKDGFAARQDLLEMGIRTDLAPRVKVGERRKLLPAACFNLTKDEKHQVCATLANVKVPYSYSSNIRNLVSMKDLKLIGLKSHDCHALMQQLLPIAIRGISQTHVKAAITRLCFFFNAICAKTIDVSSLKPLQTEIEFTLYLLEQFFPPSFFDIMLHLIVHLVREVELGGPMYMRWMYGFERYMKILKGYVRNRSRPEGCIVECYIAEEAVEFCSEYVSNVDAIGIPKPISDENTSRGVGAGTPTFTNDEEIYLAHINVLENTSVVQPYIDEHLEHLRSVNTTRRDKWIQDEHHKTFDLWLKQKIENELRTKTVPEELKWIAKGPRNMPIKYESYLVNGRRFNTKSRDDIRVNQNSGVSIVAQTMMVSSSKDKRAVYGDMSYYGTIQEIWELDYIKFRVAVFKCDWVDSNNGFKEDRMGFKLVNLSKIGHKEDHFILASQAKQRYMANDESDTPVEDSAPNEDKQPEPKKLRGPSVCKEVLKWRSQGLKVPLKWNEHGQPIGDHCRILQTYLGHLARTMVPINFIDWPSVSDTRLSNLWDDIEAMRKAQQERRSKQEYVHRSARTMNYFRKKQVVNLLWLAQNDVLAQALDKPEHPGRVRDDTQSPQPQSKNVVDPQSENADHTQPPQPQSKNVVDPQSENVDDNQPQYANDVQPGHGNKHQLDLVDDDHIHSFDDIHTPDSQGQPCRLTIESSHKVVAKGYIISTESVDTIHCQKVVKSLRVRISEVIDADAKLPNPISDEIIKVGDTFGTFLS
uniref:Transposase n=1 Tax=Cannabis sativa TaxID=3483 RepID=A0A803NIR2_CANSA